jgi:regulator of nonsense transcripts 2
MSSPATQDSEKRCNELLDLNTRAWNGDTQVFQTKGVLDTSLKKNTAFIKKIRTVITKDTETQFIDAIRTTSLEKYINEIAAALCESLCKLSKNADLPSAVEVVSALHQRFTTTFTPFVELYFVHSFVHPKEKLPSKEEKEMMIKVRNLLKLTMEFNLCGIFRTVNDMPAVELPVYLSKLKASGKDDIPIIIPVVKQIMSYDFNSGVTLPIMTSFLKRFGSMIYEQTDNPRYEDKMFVFLRKLFKSYIQNAVKIAEDTYKSIHKMRATANIIAIKIGKIVTNMETRADDLDTLLSEFSTFCEFACPLSDIAAPKLEADDVEKEELAKVTLITASQQQQQKIQQLQMWDNEEAKNFYEVIPPLTSLVSKEALESVNSKVLQQEGKGEKIADIILRLDDAETAADVDEIVSDFWELGLSNKASRNRLSKHIVELREVSKFKNLARFLKINQEYFEKCIEDLITRLDKSFRFQIRHDSITEKDILIFSELIKFKMIPIHVIFHKIRLLVLNIEINNNIDLLSLMFEGCSKILLYDDDYKDYTKEMIDMLVYAYKTKKFSHTDKYAVKVFLLSLNPPKQRAKQQVELLKEEKFLHYLIRTQLKESNTSIIATLIKCMDWNNPVIYHRIQTIFSSPGDVNYTDIRNLALVMKELTHNHNKALKVFVVDQLLEDITVGLEENDYQQLRKRLSQVIYFIELMNLRLISQDYLFPLLYKIVCFGHPNNHPSREGYCELDEPDDHFRIRLIASILSRLRCRALAKSRIKMMTTFIKFFNYYTFTKTQPLPVDLASKVDDMFDHLNESDSFAVKLAKSTSYQAALEELQCEFTSSSDVSENSTKKVQQPVDEEGDDEVDEDDDENVEDEEDNENIVINANGDIDVNKTIGLGSDEDSDGSDGSSDYDEEEDEEEEDDDDSDDEESGEEEELDDDVVEGKRRVISDDEPDDDDDNEDEDTLSKSSFDHEQAFREAELDMEYKKLVEDSLHNSSALKIKQRGALSDQLGTPEAILNKLNNKKTENTTSNDTPNNSGGVKFTFLSRSGKKLQSKQLVVPVTSKMALNVSEQQEKQRAEKDKIKNYVLNSVRNS